MTGYARDPSDGNIRRGAGDEILPGGSRVRDDLALYGNIKWDVLRQIAECRCARRHSGGAVIAAAR